MTIKELLNNQYSFNNQDLFFELPDAICNVIKSNMVTICFKAGQPIFIAGEKAKGIYRVKSGKVKKSALTSFGAQHIFYICKENEYLGYHAVLSQELYPDCAIALSDCEVDFIAEKDFLKAVNTSHLLSRRLLKNLSHEFSVFINATKILAKHTVRERSALNLLILESKFQNEAETETEIIINRNDLASMVGTAKESIVRMLKDFKEEQLITTKRSSIYIKDYEGLIKVANFK
ncbi:Crp/Fnr family transcriptional regulator [Psychroserpens burtonensis]|uniref:Crp/Fnr family transcriptional regulator n=1 Tax=Psychroserpens burtonensis TaxID=49278 RepID=A0A5C7B6N3_9FLAO|nr:Crp/Fnr family transcriptional regulator [Psychroserpens burtonensis]TXE15661.1 Crp/Fnr family transcriptional regulator [Psychroserpens burtonensis]